MFEIDYRRWGIFKSKQAFFCDHVPPTKGYHFVICTYCHNELNLQHFDKRKEQATVVIDLTQDSDNLFAQVHKNKRKMIRRGLKMAYEIIPLPPSIPLLIKFKQLFNKSIVKKGATPILSLDYLKGLMPYMTIFKAIHSNQTLAMLLVIHDEKTVRTHRLAYNEDVAVGKKIIDHMGDILYWQVLMYFKKLGYKTMDFGGIELHKVSSLQGYTRFKMSFGGEVITTFSYEIAVTPEARLFMKIMQVVEYNLRNLIHKLNR